MEKFMKNINSAEILCVGTELLLGEVINTNAAYLSLRLAELGISVYHQSVVGDNPGRLSEELSASLERADLVILTGGLGPTCDDLTKETAAELFGLPCYENMDDQSVLLLKTNSSPSVNSKIVSDFITDSEYKKVVIGLFNTVDDCYSRICQRGRESYSIDSVVYFNRCYSEIYKNLVCL